MEGEVLVVEGEVIENLPNTLFKVQLGAQYQERVVLCYLSGRMRKNYIKIMPGDKVRIELTKYDLNRGRITYRL